MHLWNDYEGKTIADTYSIGPLLRPEGRSALFALPESPQGPAIIRLTETINDESEMLKCWTRVAQLQQENLLAIKRFGETTFEGTPLTYAVMEPADANLADLLKERPLTHSEALQVASSVVAALTALHAKGLIHEHIDDANIVAVGETVKLRTDCVRECSSSPDHNGPEDCAALMQRDVHDLAMLLLRGLTLERTLTPRTSLQAPFHRIIPNAINGTWGLADIARILTPPAPAPAPTPQSPAAAAKTATASPAPTTPASTASAPASTAAPAAKAILPVTAAPAAAAPTKPQPEAAAAPLPQLELPLADTKASDNPLRYQRSSRDAADEAAHKFPVWAIYALAGIVLLAILFHAFMGKSAPKPQTAAAPAPQVVVRNTPAPTHPTAQRASAPAAAAIPAPAAPGHMQAGWYVVAYTFNHQDQAASRAAAIAQKHPSLHPEVIAPNGHSPYLVALRGPMTHAQADATRTQARQEGLPRDTFVRNYKGN